MSFSSSRSCLVPSCSCHALDNDPHHPGGPDAEGVLRERGGDAEAEPAGSGSETGGSAAASRRAGDAPLQEGTPHRRAEEVSGRCEVSSEVSTIPPQSPQNKLGFKKKRLLL